MNTEILEGNKLIAEFMGWTIEPGMENEADAFYNEPYKKGFIPRMLMLSDFHYHASWDWLMPVVEKIEKNCNAEVMIYSCCCDVGIFLPDGDDTATISSINYPKAKTKIEGAWLAVIEFIKWCNQNKKQENE